jgi:hypothetical protein
MSTTSKCTEPDSIMGLLGHDDSYLTTFVTDPAKMVADIGRSVRKMDAAITVERERGLRSIRKTIDISDFDEIHRTNFVEEAVDDSLDEYTSDHTLPMTLLEQAQPQVENGERFNMQDVTEEDVSLSLYYWIEKDDCHYSTDTKYCNLFDCPILLTIGGKNHGNLCDRRGEDILEYQVDVNNPYIVEMKNRVQKAGELGHRNENRYRREVQDRNIRRQEARANLESWISFVKSKGIYHIYTKLDLYMGHLLGYSPKKIRTYNFMIKKSEELIKGIDEQLDKIDIILDEKKADLYTSLREHIQNVMTNMTEWMKTAERTVFRITCDHMDKGGCREIREIITSYI